jgi:hypothetical protein
MRLDQESRHLLGASRIGMLALATGSYPVVNPAAFVFAGDSIWMTTSRFAAKLGMARRDPRASFLVRRGERSVLLQGVLEPYDPRTLSGAFRAVMGGPRFAFSMASYTLKNAAFIGGYMVDITGVPREWWPQNRVILRLHPEHSRVLVAGSAEAKRHDRIVGPPATVAKGLERESLAVLCWLQRGGHGPQMVPALWAVDAEDVLSWVPSGLAPPPNDAPGAIAVDYHHPFRATRMLGACPRGRFERDDSARGAIEKRYRVELAEGVGLRLRTRRVTWWRGFEVGTTAVATVIRRPAS